MKVQKRLGLKIRDLRKSKGLSQEELSEKSTIDRTYISDVERGLRNISVVNLDKIARALEVELFELFKF